ncbi:MAG TPA: ABC transporter ATP-binding protein [Geminicoccaceae bacterium]
MSDPSRPDPGGAPPAALDIRDLSHSFGRRAALDGVSFSVAPGSFTVLLGQNGAGKTTLFNLITRLYGNRSGSIRIFGIDVRAQPRAALERLGVVFQPRTIDLDLTVMRNLLYHGGLHGLDRRTTRQRAEEALRRFELHERAGDVVRTLSGGQVRRVEIARALLHAPKLLLLDEPTVGLDIGSRAFILDHVRSLCRDEEIGVLWATHLIDEIRPEDQVVVLHQGRLLAAGDGRAICERAGAPDLGRAFTRLTESAKAA